MSLFRKNVLRIAIKNRNSLLGAVVIITLGIMLFSGMISGVLAVNKASNQFVLDSNLCDGYAQVVRIPRSEAEALTDIKGLASINGMLTSDIRVAKDDCDTIITVFAIGYNPDNTKDIFHLNGNKETFDDNDIYLGFRMEEAYNFSDGDEITLSKNGETAKFYYRGTCQIPLFMDMTAEGSVAADGNQYDMALIPHAQLEKLTGYSQFYTYLGFNLEEGYEFKDIEEELKARLEPYGLMFICPLEEQDGLLSMNTGVSAIMAGGLLFPIIFLTVSIFMLFVVMSKMVSKDQTLIGTMKSFGLKNYEMICAYLIQGGLVGFAGALTGSAIAPFLGTYCFEMMNDYYHFGSGYQHSFSIALIGGLIAVFTGIISSYFSTVKILSISPAQAMKAPVPKEGLKIKFPGWLENKGYSVKTGLRNITRNPINGMMIIVAIMVFVAMSMAIVVTVYGFVKDYDSHYGIGQTGDYRLILDVPDSPTRVLESVEQLDCVESAEALAYYYGSIEYKGKIQYQNITFIGNNTELFAICDVEGKKHDVHTDGIVMSNLIAEKLGVSEGDVVNIHVSEFSNDKVPFTVVELIDEPIGRNAYLQLNSMERNFGVPECATVLTVKTIAGEKEKALEQLKKAPNILQIVDVEREGVFFLDDVITTQMILVVLAVFGVIAGGIVVYSISVINIRERITELGTMLILGFKEKMIGLMILVEQIVYYVIGIIASIPLVFLLMNILKGIVSSEFYTVPVEFDIDKFICVIVFELFVVLLSCMVQYRIIKKIKLTDILKERS